MISSQFPTSYDVQQAMTFHTTSFDELRQFMQSLGIICTGNGKSAIAEFASNVLFEHQNYIRLRDISQGAEKSTSVSGFSISGTMPIAADDLINDMSNIGRRLNQEETEYIRRGATIVQKLSTPIWDGRSIRLEYEYHRLITGRVELIQRVETKVELVLEPVSPKTWRVRCYPQANQDVDALEKLFSRTSSNSYETFKISLELFTHEQRIRFFDTILDYYRAHSEWQIQEVTGITVRQPGKGHEISLLGNEIEDESEEAETEASPDDLLSITQAVLEGSNLRTNRFVKDCERQGFYFPSMTLSLNNRNTSEAIQVTIRFKLKPLMFEVILNDMKENTEMGEIDAAFSLERQKEILKEFWDIAHQVWQSLHDDDPSQFPMGQLTLADAAKELSKKDSSNG